MLPKYNDTVSNSGCRMRRIWTPHFVESKLGLAEYDIDLLEDGEIDIFDAIQELSDYVDIDNIVKRYNNGEIDVLEINTAFEDIKSKIGSTVDSDGNVTNEASTLEITFEPKTNKLLGIDWLMPDNDNNIEKFYETSP